MGQKRLSHTPPELEGEAALQRHLLRAGNDDEWEISSRPDKREQIGVEDIRMRG
jgi:hypothetical protein